METTSEANMASSDAPLKVEVTNFADFREDLAQKLIAAVAMTTVTILTKAAYDAAIEKKRERKKAKEAKKSAKTDDNN